MLRVLVTGANGFVGREVCRQLTRRRADVIGAVRCDAAAARLPPGITAEIVGPLEEVADWKPLLAGVDAIIHLAARTHQTHDRGAQARDAYRAINVDATLRLAQDAAASGVRRFVFVSSIKAIGEGAAEAYDESSVCRPEDDYGCSKWEAERALHRELSGSHTQLTVLRPSLIYGPRARGNLQRLGDLIRRGAPLPLARVANARSLVHVEDFADAILKSLTHPAAAGKTYVVAAPDPPSTTEMIHAIAGGLGVQPRLFHVPGVLLDLAGRAIRRHSEMRRMLGSLVVDSSKIQRELDWRPAHHWRRGLEQMARSSASPVLPPASGDAPPHLPAAGSQGPPSARLHTANQDSPPPRASTARRLLKRGLDLVLVCSVLPLVVPLAAAIALLVRCTSAGPAIHWSKRVGRDNRIFLMPKFRTMRIDAPQVATHLLVDSRRYITPVGRFLRKSSLDELPQLWSVLRGEMSLVGPRPALFNQEDLIKLRTAAGVQRLTPGVTGLAQINGRDELAIPEKVRWDTEYLQRHSVSLDALILWRTVRQAALGVGVVQADEERNVELETPTRRAA